MTAFVSTARKTKNALVTLLGAIQYDAGSGPEDAFQLVTGNPAEAFDQEPYMLVYPGKSQDEIAVVGQNDRTIAFSLFIVLSLENDQRSQEETYDYMYDLVELVLNTVDVGDWTEQINATDPSLNPYSLTASGNTFYPGQSKGGAILIGTIDIAAKYTFDL